MESAWTAIPAGMKADNVCVTVFVTGGDGTESPDFANVYLHVK
jgi:hypothetical protein